MGIADLHIEEYVLDDNDRNNNLQSNSSYDDTLGLKQKLDPTAFKSEASELLKLIQFSLHQIDPSKSSLNAKSELRRIKQQANKLDANGNRQRIRKRKTMKQKQNEKKLRALQHRYTDDALFKTQSDINEELMRLLNINANKMQIELKMKAKTKWKNRRSKRLNIMQNEC